MKKKKKFKSEWLIGIITFFIGGLSGGLFIEAFNEFTSWRLLILFIIIFISIMAQIIIHEGGHLIFGLMTGYKFSSFRIGSLMLIKKKDGLKLKRFSLMGTGGQCLMAPPEMKDGDFPIVLYNLGGSITNLIISIIAFLFIGLTKDILYLNTFLVTFSVIGVIFALLNGIPIHSGVINNDGYNTLDMRRNKSARKSFYTQLKINDLSTKGVRIKDMPEELFIIPEDSSDALSTSMGVFACNRAMDAMDFEKAKNIGYSLLEEDKTLISIYKSIVSLEIMFCELISENRKDEIHKLYTKEVKKYVQASKKNPQVIRVMYAYSLLYDNNLEKAEKHMKLFEKIAKSYPNESEIEGERELIEYAKKIRSYKM